jgi:hypothetical protein
MCKARKIVAPCAFGYCAWAGPNQANGSMKRMIAAMARGACWRAVRAGAMPMPTGAAMSASRKRLKQAEAEGLKPQPGLYKATITMTGIESPACPPKWKATALG